MKTVLPSASTSSALFEGMCEQDMAGGLGSYSEGHFLCLPCPCPSPVA